MPVSPKEKARRLAARARNQRRAPGNNQQQPQQRQRPRVAPGLSLRDIFWNFERIIELLIMSGIYGTFVWGTCYAGSAIFSSFLAQAVGNAVTTAATGYAQMILPAALFPYAGLIVIGLPLAITAYHFITAAATGTLTNGKGDPSSGLQLLAMFAPFASLAIAPFFGYSMATAFICTGVSAGATTLLMSGFFQEVFDFGGRIYQRIAGTPAPQQNPPNPANRRQPGANPDTDHARAPDQTASAKNTRSHGKQNPVPATPAAQTRQKKRHGGSTLQQFGRARRSEQPARNLAADAADARAQRHQQRGLIHTTRRNPVAAPAHEVPAGPRRSERLRNH